LFLNVIHVSLISPTANPSRKLPHSLNSAYSSLSNPNFSSATFVYSFFGSSQSMSGKPLGNRSRLSNQFYMFGWGRLCFDPSGLALMEQSGCRDCSYNLFFPRALSFPTWGARKPTPFFFSLYTLPPQKVPLLGLLLALIPSERIPRMSPPSPRTFFSPMAPVKRFSDALVSAGHMSFF